MNNKKTKLPMPFCVFPALGYWEIDGKPVSAKKAQYGSHPGAIWKETEIAKSRERGEKNE